MVTKKTPRAHIALIAAFLALALVPVALAGKPVGGGGHKGGGGTGGTCTLAAPRAAADNNWAWAQTGSWGLPGQQLRYAIDVINNDLGCGSTTFVVGVSAPAGFS